MSPRLEVEITSQTTAQATWPGAEPIELTAPDRSALFSTIHRFSTQRAAAAHTPVMVVINDNGRRRVVTVTPDGLATRSDPSGTLPVTDLVPAVPQTPVPDNDRAQATDSGDDASPDTQADADPPQPVPEPVVVAAEPMTYLPGPAQDPPSGPATDPVATAEPAARPRAPSTQASTLRTTPATILARPSLLDTAHRTAGAGEPARRGLRGRLNGALHLRLAPTPDSAEMRLRAAVARIAAPVGEFKVVTVANLKGGVGKTPLAIGLSSTIASHRGTNCVVCADLGEVGGSLADRAAIAPPLAQTVPALLAAAEQIRRRPATLARLMTRQPTGEDLLAGRQGLAGAAPLDAEHAAALAAIVSRHREILVADTGNNQLAGSWQWAVSHADVLVVPVPLRRDAAVAAARMLLDIAEIDPGVLARTVVIVTDGPGDQPMVETDAVEAFVQLDVAHVLRMPYEPLFAGGEPILAGQLRAATTESLTVTAATVVELMTTTR